MMKLNKDKWKKVKLGDVCLIDPSKNEINSVDDETIVSFVTLLP